MNLSLVLKNKGRIRKPIILTERLCTEDRDEKKGMIRLGGKQWRFNYGENY